ncbi:1-aminocyclopropane-1-carboxylate oxidase [Melia azedarach]|uniref:1-aminocyclopropane-1-carboxylate oxidase n=1 Tax=Melia azedarach TaxID=155640 RepID=A0ACC1YI17_MELAZ|nr:1-aminocyclopropane-1-carboxylate oxidase [Melia azedarach]
MKQSMYISNASVSKPSSQTLPDYDRAEEVKAFDETKAGVKGLVDAGIVNIPKMFIRPPDELTEELISHKTNFQVPVIDLRGFRHNKLEEILDQVRFASQTWGFFQVVNHGIPFEVLEEMINAARNFHEQDLEEKKEFYTRDRTRSVRLDSNFDLYHSRTASWRDTLTISTLVHKNLDSNKVPEVCRAAAEEYIKQVTKLGDTLFELLSMALGLKPEYLHDMGCSSGHNLVCHYYPPCPQPELTLGASRHSDPSFLTILLQDQIGGLQVFYENQWIDVEPIAGGLVVNIGAFLQVVSNDKFKSFDHRVAANHVGPRVSVACFFTGHDTVTPKPYGPIKELISEENPAIYGDFLISEYFSKYGTRALDGKSGLDLFKL